MTRAACLALAMLASAAHAEPRHEWPGTAASGYRSAWVEIHEPTEPGAVAAVTFQNEPVHEADEAFAVTRDGLTVRIEMEWQADDGQEERLTLHPPEGFVAVPRTLTVPESATATAQIYAFGPNS